MLKREKTSGASLTLEPEQPIIWDFWWHSAMARNATNELATIARRARDHFAISVETKGGQVAATRMVVGMMLAATPSAEADLEVAARLLDFESPVYKRAQTFARGQLLYQRGRAREAIPLFEQVSRDWPVQSLFWLAMAHEGAGEREKGRAIFEKALVLKKELQKPGDPWTELAMHDFLIRKTTAVFGEPGIDRQKER
jgi:hypothetical protein